MTAGARERSEDFREVIRHLMEDGGMTNSEAMVWFQGQNGSKRDSLRRQAHERLLAKRREAAGNPTFQPKWPHLQGRSA